MTCSSDVADYLWLTGAEAAEHLAELAASPSALHSAAERLRRKLSPDRTHLLLEQVELRVRAAAKFAEADRMFFTRVALEQATDQWVAAYKAARFAGRGPVAELCCGIGGDFIALAECGPVTGVDRDPIATCLAEANARAVLAPEAAKDTAVRTADVESFDLGDFAAWHLDPDRRPAGSRTTSLDWSSPPQATVDRLLAAVPDAAVKLAPAAEVPDDWRNSCELEWIGRDRQCRQLVAWHGNLAHNPGLRRATVLTQVDGAGATNARSIVGQPDLYVPIADHLEQFIFEADAAVLAAHLTGALAAEHDLAAVAAGPSYLTGPAPVADAALACFEVEEIFLAKIRLLADSLRQRGIGQLEIKKRGVDLDPERVRGELKLRGNRTATLLFTSLDGRHVAILARRIVGNAKMPEPIPLTTDN